MTIPHIASAVLGSMRLFAERLILRLGHEPNVGPGVGAEVEGEGLKMLVEP